jgi:hypothetical protein
MASFTKLYELSIISSDPTGEDKDVVYVSFFEISGSVKKLVAQQQFNPKTLPVTMAEQFAGEVASGLVHDAFTPA